MLKAFKKYQYTHIYGLLSSALVAVVLCVWVFTIQQFQGEVIAQIDTKIESVDGMRDMITPVEINALITRYLDTPVSDILFADVDTKEIEKLIKSDSRVYDTRVFMDARRHLVVEIDQRRPILRIKDHSGADYYLDQSGYQVSKSTYRAVRVPVVTGHVGNASDDWYDDETHNMNKLYRIGQIIDQDEFLKALIEQIHFERSGRIVFVPKIGFKKIVMDYTDDLERKLTYNLKIFYQSMAQTNSWKKYDELDISYRNQVRPKKSVNP